MAYRDLETGRARDRERFRKRTAERRATGLCPRCGLTPPASGRSLCETCAGKRNAANRARDARLRAAGKPRRDPARARACERERTRRQTTERLVRGVCTRCGKHPAAPERKNCEPCIENRRAADRARYAAGKAAGKLYGGADPAVKRRSARAKSKQRQKTRRVAGFCIRCGARPPVDGGTTCTPCRDKRQAAERRQYAERRATGLCTRCGGPVFDGLSRCGPCAVIDEASRSPERKNSASRRRYRERRARGECTSCGAPSQGAARCQPCADRSYERSQHFRGMPLYPPSFAVILRETDECLAEFDDEMEVAAWLAFEKLTRDQVEVVADRPWLATLTAWE